MINRPPSLRKQKSAAEDWYHHTRSTCNDKNHSYELWSEIYSPNSVNEVAVHHDKLQEVLEACKLFQKHTRAILLLIGPPGSGKSACLRAVCRSIGLSDQFLQWNGVEGSSGQATDEMQQFEDFLLGAARYSNAGISFKQSVNAPIQKGMQVILIETLPQGICDKTARFHQQLRSFLSKVISPTLLVFVLTKSNSTIASSSLSTCEFDNTALNRLFPPNLKDELNMTQIEFNPIASSIMLKALTRITNLATKEHDLLMPPRSFLQGLSASSSGDLRLALNNLQFMLTHAPKKNKSTKCALESSFVQFTERDSGLVLFHALGKILYAKRFPIADSTNSLLPKHLIHWKRDPLSFTHETVLDQCGLSGDNVIAWLHENYPLFASHLAPFEWISEQLSFADAHLIGGMNWRLGLTPAADRNSDQSSILARSAGKHYAAMYVSRAVSLCPKSHNDSYSSRGFRPLKAPQSKQNDWHVKDVQLKIREYATLAAVQNCSGAQIQATVVGAWMETVLDRLPMEYKIDPKAVSSEELIQSVCIFGKSNLAWNQRTNTQRPWKNGSSNCEVLSQEDLPFQSYCLPDAAAEGDAFTIDENFEEDSEPPLF